MVEHKIQSTSGLILNLTQVPKMLTALVNEWAKDCFIVSFKLETDENFVILKSKKAINNYGVHLVVANQLQVENLTLNFILNYRMFILYVQYQIINVSYFYIFFIIIINSLFLSSLYSISLSNIFF